jgi:hypothetical protein
MFYTRINKMKVYSYLTPGPSPKERGVGVVGLLDRCPVRDNRSVEIKNKY